MSEEPKEPFQESNLDSPEYRDRLIRKLNTLIAVLEVANAKVEKSLNGPDPDIARLTKIQGNLSSTLEVCRRARRALERRESLPADLPEGLAAVTGAEGGPKALPDGARFEMTSPEEHARFVGLGGIEKNEIEDCDFDDLARRLQE